MRLAHCTLETPSPREKATPTFLAGRCAIEKETLHTRPNKVKSPFRQCETCDSQLRYRYRGQPLSWRLRGCPLAFYKTNIQNKNSKNSKNYNSNCTSTQPYTTVNNCTCVPADIGRTPISPSQRLFFFYKYNFSLLFWPLYEPNILRLAPITRNNALPF